MGSKKFIKPQESERMKHLVQCVNGHLFDYRERIRVDIDEEDKKHYAPCQGRCPRCGTTEFTFLGKDDRCIYPILWNFIGADWNMNGKRSRN